MRLFPPLDTYISPSEPNLTSVGRASPELAADADKGAGLALYFRTWLVPELATYR